ncbi:MAG TPA: hypothetical protein VEY30_06515 [Myxococcaceae bacterium]|nr:hypothetical protein [Myxococcaceae bacterium]
MAPKKKRETLAELAQRAARELEERGALSRMELELEEAKARMGEEEMAKRLAALPPETGRPKSCPLCGKNARVRSKDVPRRFTSLSGTHTIVRHYHYCEGCQAGFFPRDELLGLPKTGAVSAELEKRLADLSGREAKRGQLLRARYAAHLGGQEDFKTQLQAALKVETTGLVGRKVWVGDGALGNWHLASTLAPSAIQILDFHHALEHAMDLEKVFLGEGHPDSKARKTLWEERLLSGDVDASVRHLMDRLDEADTEAKISALNDLVRYYRNNENRMRYHRYREAGLLIGSGPVESAHRHVIQARMKKAGQHWGTRGGRQMARLRAHYRTAGPERFLDALRWAHRETLQQPRAQPKPTKRYASNR